MNKTNLKNIVIVLVEPKEPGNIGSCCRAMKNMGITQLRMVNPVAYHVPDTFRLCYGADDLVHNAQCYDDLASAVSDMDYVVGTTRRKGKRRKPVYWLSEVIGNIARYSQNNKVAVLFGREAKGLSNEELSLCHAQISIPTRDDFPTLNLAQSVLIVCYELFLTKYPPDKTVLHLTSHKELADMYRHISDVLSLIGYGKQGSRNLHGRIIAGLKRIFGRAGLEKRDAQMIHGLASQIELKLNKLKNI